MEAPSTVIDRKRLAGDVESLQRQIAAADEAVMHAQQRATQLRGALGYARTLLASLPPEVPVITPPAA